MIRVSSLLLAVGFLFLQATSFLSQALAAAEPGSPSGQPRVTKGIFLVASPNMMDPNFRHTVVLICEHNEQGTMGVIVNRPTDVLLSEALPQVPVLKATSYLVFWGGPVQQSTILMLFRLTNPPTDPKEVLAGVYLGAGAETLTHVITKPNPTETFRAFAGYAGWAPAQLEYEMALGSWAILSADATSLFDTDPANLWVDLIEKLRAPRVIRYDSSSGNSAVSLRR